MSQSEFTKMSTGTIQGPLHNPNLYSPNYITNFPKPASYARQTALDFAIKADGFGTEDTLQRAEVFYQFLIKE